MSDYLDEELIENEQDLPSEAAPHSPIRQILREKGPRVVTCPRSATAREALRKMVENNVGSVLVTEGNEAGVNVCGIFTERDFVRRVALEDRDPRETRVEDVMTREVVCVDPAYTVNECMSIMTHEKLRHLPVMDHQKLVGLISIGDCVKQTSQDAQTNIRYLKDYIRGKYPG